MSTLRTALIVFLVVLAAGCNKKPADQAASGSAPDVGKIIASVNGQNITESNYENYLHLRQQQMGTIPDKVKEKQVVLDEMINKMLLAQYAIDNKLDKEPEVAAMMKRVHEEILAQAVRRKLLQDNPITESDIRTSFEQQVANTNKSEYKVRHILVKDESEAKAIIVQLQKGANFNKLAEEKSIDTQSAKEGGEIGWINQGMVLPEFFNAVMNMKKDSITTEPVKTEFGWHIIKLEDTRPLKMPTFDEFMANPQARASLMRKLTEEKINALIKKLKAKAKITEN